MELLLVMGVMAVFMGMGIGYLTSIGKTAQAMQAASKITEAASRCQNLSAGGRRATLDIRMQRGPNGDDQLFAYTAIQRPILTANFEPPMKDHPEMDWFVNSGSPDTAKPVGAVTLEDDGNTAVAIARGGYVDFGTRSSFAVTDGLFVGCRVKPSGGAGNMRLLQSEQSPTTFWTLTLVRPSGSGPDAYQVEMRLWLVPAEVDDASAAPTPEIFTTKNACVVAGRWNRLEASFDGRDASIRVDGVERLVREKRKGPPTAKDLEGLGVRRFARTVDGVAHLTLSSASGTFAGSVDTLEVSGIFRTPEDVQRLGGGVEFVRPDLPIRIVYANGRLDPAVHPNDVVMLLATPADKESGSAYEIRLGLYGAIPPPRRTIPTPATPGAAPAGAPIVTPGSAPVATPAEDPVMGGRK